MGLVPLEGQKVLIKCWWTTEETPPPGLTRWRGRSACADLSSHRHTAGGEVVRVQSTVWQTCCQQMGEPICVARVHANTSKIASLYPIQSIYLA